MPLMPNAKHQTLKAKTNMPRDWGGFPSTFVSTYISLLFALIPVIHVCIDGIPCIIFVASSWYPAVSAPPFRSASGLVCTPNLQLEFQRRETLKYHPPLYPGLLRAAAGEDGRSRPRLSATAHICRRAFASSPLLRDPATSSQPSKTKNTHLKVSQPAAPKITHGSLAPGSIFDEDDGIMPSPYSSTDSRKPQRLTSRDTAADTDATTNATSEADSASTANSKVKVPLHERDQDNLLRALVPFPNRRARWERKMVIRSIRRRGRLTRREEIARTERESLSKSHFFKTSVKKLMMVARQIAGKNIDDAILQMRFSPKKVAKDVKAHLELARDEAVVLHGMGLGRNRKINGKQQEPESRYGEIQGQFFLQSFLVGMSRIAFTDL
ncbi:mitochondrial large ribosomal subunit [Histoplasma capsulatum]|uniref:Mitochondrial large ribosomal subunit n=1 Tax=Ajellomyces capsulatus TaxID=5037 RepID=A0A8A1M4U8_AJECA|nr:mitochondrial large ribosomal subunit [Histoplasma capsulatum]